MRKKIWLERENKENQDTEYKLRINEHENINNRGEAIKQEWLLRLRFTIINGLT